MTFFGNMAVYIIILNAINAKLISRCEDNLYQLFDEKFQLPYNKI